MKSRRRPIDNGNSEQVVKRDWFACRRQGSRTGYGIGRRLSCRGRVSVFLCVRPTATIWKGSRMHGIEVVQARQKRVDIPCK